MKKAVFIILSVILLAAAGFWMLISTNPDLAEELGLASGPGKPAENISMNEVIANAPSITGIVKETTDGAILIENENGEYWVSLNVENKDSMTHFSVGAELDTNCFKCCHFIDCFRLLSCKLQYWGAKIAILSQCAAIFFEMDL